MSCISVEPNRVCERYAVRLQSDLDLAQYFQLRIDLSEHPVEHTAIYNRHFLRHARLFQLPDNSSQYFSAYYNE